MLLRECHRFRSPIRVSAFLSTPTGHLQCGYSLRFVTCCFAINRLNLICAQPEQAVKELQLKLWQAFPHCDEQNTKNDEKEFIPHLSVGQWSSMVLGLITSNEILGRGSHFFASLP